MIITSLKKILYHKHNLIPDLMPVGAYLKLTGMKLLTPFYHTVSDHPLPHLNCLYRVRTSREFETDLDMMLKDFEPFDLQTLIKAVREKIRFHKPAFFLSFDDGLREFNDIAAPVLLRKGIPATCFLNAAFIDNTDLFFRYKVCLIFNEINKNHKELTPLVNKWLTDKKVRTSSWRNFLMKIDYNQRHLADELASLIDLSFDNYLRDQKPYLTTGQITGLIKKGFTFGSHSSDHPLFADIPLEEQIRQTVESTKEITAMFNLPYKVFSFPFSDSGVHTDFFRKTDDAVHFDLTFGCAGMKKDGIHNHLQRIPVEYYDLTFRKRIKRDFFYYILKAPFGTNKVKRRG